MHRKHKSFLCVLCFFVAIFLFFSPSFENYFVADDFHFLGRITLANAGSYLTESWGYGNEYRPVLAFSYALDAAISGTNPVGYHVTNTLLHIANALLIGSLALSAGAGAAVAVIAASIFVLNPVTHESVLWISGRPVLLGSFFILTSCYFFVRATLSKKNQFQSWIAAYAAFILGLGSYELAIATPLLALLVCRVAAPDTAYRRHVLMFVMIGTLYLLLWNWLFDFRVTRFPIETSPLAAMRSFVAAFAHSLHGSLRLRLVGLYVLLFAVIVRHRSGRGLFLAAFLWFLCAYLPFFLVRGYADRFAYLASGAAAVLIAAGFYELTKLSRYLGLPVALFLSGYFIIGMQNRITAWKEAGEMARSIPQQIKQTVPTFPKENLLVLLNVPQVHKRAYVYFSGLDRALQMQYPGEQIKFSTTLRPWADESSVILEYSSGQMIRREFNEVRQRYD
jgi:hypothetical protein